MKLNSKNTYNSLSLVVNILGQKSKKIMAIPIASSERPFLLQCGAKLTHAEIAYETYGTLNPDKSNVLLISHALTGDSHVGTYPDEPEIKGWWHEFLGPGLIFDTSKYFIICSNVLGGCMGSTGPASIDTETNKPFKLKFPLVTIKDMVHAQKILLDKLKIPTILAIIGGSMGGMQVLQWAISYPDMVKAVIPIATTSRLSPQGIALNEVGRRAIINDLQWDDGNYSNAPPKKGLALARMIAHITYLSDESMRRKFGRNLSNHEQLQYGMAQEFEVESYLDHQGIKFTKRFDANSYIYLTKALDYFDLVTEYGSLFNAFKKTTSKFLVMAFKSDWLYPIYQSKEIVVALQQVGRDVSYCEIDSNYGHDAFLLEYDKMAPILIPFLEKIHADVKSELHAGVTPR